MAAAAPRTRTTGGGWNRSTDLEVPQRYAVNLFKLDDQHRSWVGDPSQLSSYVSYRQPILAAAAGTVVAAQDGLPNSAEIPHPTNLATVKETVGNHVIVQISDEIYVLYAHMDPGSVAVRVGDRVARGQQLGRIGNSGISTTPHLHFRILTTPTYFRPTASRMRSTPSPCSAASRNGCGTTTSASSRPVRCHSRRPPPRRHARTSCPWTGTWSSSVHDRPSASTHSTKAPPSRQSRARVAAPGACVCPR